MKIKTRLLVSIVMLVGVALIIGGLLYSDNKRADEAAVACRVVDDVATRIIRLNAITSSYLLDRTSTTEARWRTGHEELRTAIATASRNIPKQHNMARLRENHAAMTSLFDQVVADHGHSDERIAFDRGTAATQLIQHMQAMQAATVALSAVVLNEALAAQQIGDIQAMSGAMILIVIALITAIILNRRLAQGIDDLQIGASELASGNLDYRIPATSRIDELSELATLFNGMGDEVRRSHAAQLAQNSELATALTRLERAQSATIEQEKTNAIRQLARGIVHNFNNSLTTIMVSSDLLEEDEDYRRDDDKLLEYLGDIKNAATDISKLVARLADLVRTDPIGRVTAIDLNQLVEETVDMTRPMWKEEAESAGQQIDVNTDLGDIPPVSGTEGELRELFADLIIEAVRSMSADGDVTVRTFAENGSVVVQVSDTGRGMDAEAATHCFEPFFNPTGAARGGSIRLAIVHSIVQRHKGTIAVASDVGVGTTFTIHLPSVDGSAPPSEARDVVGNAQVSDLSILVVDDEPAERKLLSDCLRADGHRVETSGDGQDAFRNYQNGNFDLVITDWASPKMNGRQLGEAIRGVNRNAVVILLTGFAKDEAAESAKHLELFDDVVRKPVTADALRQAVQKVMRGRDVASPTATATD